MNKLQIPLLLCVLITSTTTLLHSISTTDFIFNGFDPSNLSLFGNASIQSGFLTLTNDSTFSIGRALYREKIATKEQNTSQVLQFSTSFIFAMESYKGKIPGHGMVFLFAPHSGLRGASSAPYLGLFNFTNNGLSSNHVFGVEFDVLKNDDLHDIDDNHVGIDVNSLDSVSAHEAGYWPDGGSKSFKKLKLRNGKNYQVWIDYVDGIVNVTMAPAGVKRPKKPLLSVSLNLSEVFEDEMYVGFTAATGALIQSHKILAWSFSNKNFSLSEALITEDLPSFEPRTTPLRRRKGFIAGMTVGCLFLTMAGSLVAFFFIKKKRRLRKEREEMEDWEFEYWPHRISYQEIDSATKRFADENVIGIGGNGKVYRGVFPGGEEVAVKRFSIENIQGNRAFSAEISSLGRLKHRNLVGLRGWCKKEKGSLMLVYEYMQNGSLDKLLFDCDDCKMLSYGDRIRILTQVASGVLYLHDGWESKVLHRDIKASNVLLDKDMNARLGDFGLARMHSNDQIAGTTCVVGTVGYLAPEVVKSGRASTQTDVFGYGVLILETICGRRPVEEGSPPLLEWVWEFLRRGELVDVVDARLKTTNGFDENEVELVLYLGLLCAHPNPNSRPTMRQVVKLLEGKNGLDESESEDPDKFLLEAVKAKDIRSIFPQSLRHNLSKDPTFDEIKEGSSSSMWNSWSSTYVKGR